MKKLIFPLIFTALAVTAVSCSSDDEPRDTNKPLEVNLVIGDPTSTIGTSDVYIDRALNLTSSRCGIASLGRKGGMDRNPELKQLSYNVAAEQGKYYQIFLADNITEVAGERALAINKAYYNLRIDSWLDDRKGDRAGAKIEFKECYGSTSRLPKWNETIPVQLTAGKISNTYSAEYKFDSKARIDPDYETYGNDFPGLEVEIKDNKITLYQEASWGGINFDGPYQAEIALNVRYESSYTRVRLDVRL